MLTLKNLLLVNDDSHPTWHHDTHTSRVLDLIFAHGSLLQDKKFAYQNNIDGRGPSNHSLLNLFLRSHAAHYKQAFIAKNSDNEFDFTCNLANTIINILGSDDLHDIQCKADNFSSRMAESWINNSKSLSDKGNPQTLGGITLVKWLKRSMNLINLMLTDKLITMSSSLPNLISLKRN